MAQAYAPIQTITLTSSASSISFTNIPQNYTDLVLKCSLRSTVSNINDDVLISYNSNTSSYSWRLIQGTGSGSVSSYNGTDRRYTTINGNTATSNTFSNFEVYIPNYAGSSYKSASIDTVNENNATTNYYELVASLWSNTAAITSITFTLTSGNFAQYSSATLYGIGGVRATGGTITADSQYTYHTFTSSGTFTALENIQNAEVLVVAGGGGGGGGTGAGGAGGGGGGAGGLLYSSGNLLNAGSSYTVIVGGGGSARVAGSNSLFRSLTSIGGGNGPEGAGAGATGGSGGGGTTDGGLTAGAGGAGTAGQGNNGGSAGGSGSGSTRTYLGGGGGGASTVGENQNGSVAGAGGTGSSAYSAWGYATSTGQLSGGVYYYAGGGGGGSGRESSGGGTAGTGGLGGGANGRKDAGSVSNATANTGGGGGGGAFFGGSYYAGSAGGSGIIIIRYPN